MHHALRTTLPIMRTQSPGPFTHAQVLTRLFPPGVPPSIQCGSSMFFDQSRIAARAVAILVGCAGLNRNNCIMVACHLYTALYATISMLTSAADTFDFHQNAPGMLKNDIPRTTVHVMMHAFMRTCANITCFALVSDGPGKPCLALYTPIVHPWFVWLYQLVLPLGCFCLAAFGNRRAPVHVVVSGISSFPFLPLLHRKSPMQSMYTLVFTTQGSWLASVFNMSCIPRYVDALHITHITTC